MFSRSAILAALVAGKPTLFSNEMSPAHKG